MSTRPAIALLTLSAFAVLAIGGSFLFLLDGKQPCGFIDTLQGRPSGCLDVFNPDASEQFNAVSFAADGQTLAMVESPQTGQNGGDLQGKLVVIDLKDRRITHSVDLPGDNYGHFIDGEVLYGNQFWNAADGKPSGAIPELDPEGALSGFEFLPDRRILVWNLDGAALIQDRDTGDLLQRVRDSGPPNSHIFTVSRDGRILAVGGCDSIEFIELASGHRTPSPLSHIPDYDVTDSVALSPDGTVLAMACQDGYNPTDLIGVWETAAGKELAAFEAPTHKLQLALSPDNSTLIASTSDRHLRVFNVQARREVQNLGWPNRPFDHPGYSNERAFSRNGQYFAIAWDDGRVALFDVNRWRSAAGLSALTAVIPTDTPFPGRTHGPTPTRGPTRTPTNTPNPADQAQAAMDRLTAAKKWPIVFSDTFDSNANRWPLREHNGAMPATAVIRGGVYRWSAHPDWSVLLWEPPARRVERANAYISLDARRVSGPTDEAYGLVFREGADHISFYAFRINDDGEYQFLVLKPGTIAWDTVSWTPSTAIRRGDTNRLAVISQRSQMFLFVNDQFVRIVEDDDLQSGGIGVTFDVTEGVDNVFEFDNINVRAP